MMLPMPLPAHLLAPSSAPNTPHKENVGNTLTLKSSSLASAVLPTTQHYNTRRRTRVRQAGSVSITGNSPRYAAHQSALRASRRSHSPALRSELEGFSSRFAHNSSVPTVTFRLPTSLPRPRSFPMVTERQLEALDPDLEGVALPYVKDQLHNLRDTLLRGLASVNTQSATLPSSGLPSEVRISLSGEPKGVLPTHLFCVVDQQSGRGHIYPSHGLVLGAHCARLPELPQPRVQDPKDPISITLPVVAISLPHIESFNLLHDYMYTKHFARFMSALVPLPPSALPSPEEQLSPEEKTRRVIAALSQTYTVGALVERLRFVHGVWGNVVSLGMAEEGVWKVMQIAWSVLSQAAALSQKSSAAQQ